MGKIKSKLVKRTSNELIKRGIEFKGSFDQNKKILGRNTMSSKKIRNQAAGFLAKLIKNK